MRASFFAILVVSALFGVAAFPLRSALRKSQLYVSDIALPIIPAVGFVLMLLEFNRPAQIGWALIAYPFLIVALSIVILYISVFGFRNLFAKTRALSFAVLAATSASAMYFGATVAPWYE